MARILTGIASPPDIPDILEFWKNAESAAFSSVAAGMGLKDYISKNPFTCLVAEQKGSICATVVFGVKEYRGFIHHIALEKDCIGKGILKTLVSEAFEALRKRNCTRCHVFVHDMASNDVTREIMEELAWAHAGGSQIFTHDLEYPLEDNDISVKPKEK